MTCHSYAKLKSSATGYYLHSHEVNYGSGSKQQSVTGVNTNADANSLWEIAPENGGACETGQKIRCGQTIRLVHLKTQRMLHR